MPVFDTPLVADDATVSSYDSVILSIVNYVYKFEIDSVKALTNAQTALLDALGCAVECLETDRSARSIIGPIVPGTVVPNGFKLPGTPYQLDPLKGSFDLGALIRYLDHNDAFPGAEWGHPSDNIGSILAVADWLSRTYPNGRDEQAGPPLTLRTVLIAMTKAYEIQGCFQIANAFNEVGLDHTILVKIGSTAVVSWLLGLTEEQACAALSQAWMDGHPLRTFRQAPNTGPRKGWAAGDACMRAVHLNLLAKNGQPGAPTVLTTPKWGFYDALFKGKEFKLPRPFHSYVMENIFFKLIPAEGHGISALEAAMKLTPILAARNLNPRKDIVKIHVRTHDAACKIINKTGVLQNAADRDHCMQYMVAVVLLKGSGIEVADYRDSSPWATDKDVEVLRSKIFLTEDPALTADYHGKRKTAASGLTLELTDGSTLDEVLVEYPIGHPWRDDTAQAVAEKINKNLSLLYSDLEISKMLDTVSNHEIPVSTFVDLFARNA